MPASPDGYLLAGTLYRVVLQCPTADLPFFFPPTTTSNNLNIPGLFNKAEHPIQLWKLLAPGCPLCHMSRLRVGQLMGGIWLLRRHYWPLNAWQKREKKSLLNNNTNGTLRAHNRSAGCHSLTLM